MSDATAGPSVAGDVSYSNSATLRVVAGPLAGPTMCRVVSMLAARAQCPVDRLDDALLVCDALTEHGAEQATDGRLAMSVEVHESGLRLRLGPLVAGGAEAIVRDAALPGVGNVLEQLTDELRVEIDGDGSETLLISFPFGR